MLAGFGDSVVGFVLGALRPKLPPTLSVKRAPESEHPLYIFVHGTWGRSARTSWAAESSPLGERLAKVDPDAGFAFYLWRGGNRLSDRMRAAEQLVTELEAYRREHGPHPFIAVSHSHGGNVVAWAAKKSPQLFASIYINTPFSQFRKWGLPALIYGSIGLTTAWMSLFFGLLDKYEARLGLEFLRRNDYWALLMVLAEFGLTWWACMVMWRAMNLVPELTTSERHIEHELVVHAVVDLQLNRGNEVVDSKGNSTNWLHGPWHLNR